MSFGWPRAGRGFRSYECRDENARRYLRGLIDFFLVLALDHDIDGRLEYLLVLGWNGPKLVLAPCLRSFGRRVRSWAPGETFCSVIFVYDVSATSTSTATSASVVASIFASVSFLLILTLVFIFIFVGSVPFFVLFFFQVLDFIVIFVVLLLLLVIFLGQLQVALHILFVFLLSGFRALVPNLWRSWTNAPPYRWRASSSTRGPAS